MEAELLYQRGTAPAATYTFKHAPIQDTAYQSLLKSVRQQFHARIAQVLDERFPERVAAEPEVIARHYVQAGLTRQAIGHYQRAGERATQILFVLAEDVRRVGRHDEALGALALGLAQAEQQGQHYYDAELHRLRAEILLDMARPVANGFPPGEGEGREATVANGGPHPHPLPEGEGVAVLPE